jgi:hypothetical protein
VFTYLVWIAIAVSAVIVVAAAVRVATAARGFARVQAKLQRGLQPELDRLEARTAELQRTSTAASEGAARVAAAGAALSESGQALGTAVAAAREGLAPLLAARAELAP